MLARTLTTAIMLSSVFHAQADEYKLDPAHTNARFEIDHFNTSTNHGGFYNLEGKLTYDKKNKRGNIDLIIPLENLNSGNKQFDKHLKSADLFNAEKYPVMKFKSTQWHFDDDELEEVEGKLTILGKTQSVVLKAENFNCYHNPMHNAEVCGGDFEAEIDRTDWGMNYLVDKGMTKEVDLLIQIEAIKQP